MRKKSLTILAIILLLLVCSLSPLLTYAETMYANKNTELISKINSAYYNLKKKGLQEFKCEITNSALEQLKDALNLQFSAEDSKE